MNKAAVRYRPLTVLKLRTKVRFYARELPGPEFLPYTLSAKDFVFSNEITSCYKFIDYSRYRAANRPFSYISLPEYRRSPRCHHKALNSISAI